MEPDMEYIGFTADTSTVAERNSQVTGNSSTNDTGTDF